MNLPWQMRWTAAPLMGCLLAVMPMAVCGASNADSAPANSSLTPGAYNGKDGPATVRDIDWGGPLGSGELCWWERDGNGRAVARHCGKPEVRSCGGPVRAAIALSPNDVCDPRKAQVCTNEASDIGQATMLNSATERCRTFTNLSVESKLYTALPETVITSAWFDMAFPKGAVVDTKNGCRHFVTCIKLQVSGATPADTPNVWVPYRQPTAEWQVLPGEGMDIGAAGNGALWVVGSIPQTSGFSTHRWTAASGFAQINSGGAVRIAVDSQGNAWIADRGGFIWRWDGAGNRFAPLMQGAAKDIAVGHNGTVWVVGTDNGVYRWSGTRFDYMGPGPARHVAVDPSGNAWIVTRDGDIRRWNGSAWVNVPGKAYDIGIGGNGSIFVVGTDGAVFKWNGSSWNQRPGWLHAISVDANGVPYGITPVGEIVRGIP